MVQWRDQMWGHNTYCPGRPSSVTRYTTCHSLLPKLERFAFGLVVLCAIAVPRLAAHSTEEFDSYKLRLAGDWVYSTPTGSFQGSANTDKGAIDLTADLHFTPCSAKRQKCGSPLVSARADHRGCRPLLFPSRLSCLRSRNRLIGFD